MLRSLRRWLLFATLVVAAYVGFRWGGAVFDPLERALGGRAGADASADVATPELAEATLARFERFRAGETGDRLALSGAELTAVLRHAMPGILPPGLTEPTVELRAGDVHLAARVAVDRFPDLPDLVEVVGGLLPDTVPFVVRGELVPLDQAHMSMVVNRVSVARVPLPGGLVTDVLDGLGRDGADGLPPDALRVPLPDGLERAYVQRDSLVLIARPRTDREGG